MSYGLPFIGVSVSGDDGIVHLSFGDGTDPLLLEAFDKVVILTIHVNNFISLQIKLVT